MLEKLTRDKHFSLLIKVVTYDRKKFYNIGPGSLMSYGLIRVGERGLKWSQFRRQFEENFGKSSTPEGQFPRMGQRSF
jgi:hypothetical protein